MTAETLNKAIESIVLEKTVNLDAIQAINALKQRAAEIDQALAASKAREESLWQTLRNKDEQLTQLNEQLVQLRHQEVKMAQSLEAAKNAQQKGLEAVAELKGFTNAMQMVFKPSAVREVIQKRVPVPVPGNPGGNGTYPSAGFVLESSETGAVERHAE